MKCFTVDLITLYLGLELTTLCSYILVGITVQGMASNEAAIKYFLLASFASAVLLYGISLTYGVTGTTNFVAIASALSEHSGWAMPTTRRDLPPTNWWAMPTLPCWRRR